MNKQALITMLLALVTLTVQAKVKTTVWENPTIEYGTNNGDGFFNLVLDVTKVELKDNETVVYITALQRSDYPDYWFRFAEDTYLKVGEKRFTIVSADGIELGKQVQSHKDGRRDMAFHFPPLPQDTKVFDFIEGDGQGAFQIKGIKPVEERWKQLFPSYWRDDQTGDWKIAFFEDCAIYDSRFWNYKQCDANAKTGEATMILSHGNDEMKVVVGKNKKGLRTIQIGNEKAVYSMITSRFLPDYPTKDTRTDFVDNGYQMDTVTVIGWIKDLPKQYKQNKTFGFGFANLFTDDQEEIYADLDEQGRFTVKIPLVNSTQVAIDWERCFVRTLLEPGKTYFMLYDFKEGRRFFMGEDVRLQNELFKYPLDWNSVQMKSGKKRPQEGDDVSGLFDKYIVSVDSLLTAQKASIDSLCQAHPTLSTRYEKYRKGNTLIMQASNFGQARFNGLNFQFPDNAFRYATDTFWKKLEKPYTLYANLSTFLNDYLDDITTKKSNTFTWDIRDHIAEFSSNEEELALLKRWKDWVTDAQSQVEAAPTMEEKQKIAEKLNTENAEMIGQVEKILNSTNARKVINTKMLLSRMNIHHQILDSLGADSFIKDVWLSRMVNKAIDQNRTSLPQEVIDTLKALSHYTNGIEILEKRNAHYLAIENREFDKLVIKSSDNLKDLSEGEALLKKIVEPFKGKFVLLDIWGTWCGPCKEALSHSTEEYARLKDYDIEFLYLANNSPQDSWENIIKEYNVSGDNVAHYNLPTEQQSAIERHLNVHAWPTYKLFDRDGNLLDIDVDARDLDALANLLERMK